MFDMLKNYMLDLYAGESGIIKNFIQGACWKEKLKSFGDKFVIPLFAYEDDLETGDPLGFSAGKHKLGAVYTSIPC